MVNLQRNKAADGRRIQRELELEAMVSVAGLIAQEGPLSEKMTRALEKILEVTDARGAGYRNLDEGGKLEGMWTVGDPTIANVINPNGKSPVRPGGLADLALRTGVPQFRDSYSGNPSSRRRLVKAGIGSAAAFPVRSSKGIIGMILIACDRDSFGYPHVCLMTSIADYVGAIIEQARLLEAEMLHAKELSALLEVSRVLVRPEPLEVRVRTALQVLVDVSGADRAILRMEREGEGLTLVGLVGSPDPDIKDVQSDPDSTSNRAFQSGQTVIRQGFRSRKREGSVVALPMNTSNGTIGVVVLGSSDRNLFTPGVTSLMESIVTFMGVVLQSQAMRKEIDVHQALAERRDNFIATASHELRTPMSTIIGLSELLIERDPQDAEERRRWYRMIHRDSSRLSDIVSDMLDITRIQSGAFHLDIGPVSLREIVESVVGPLNDADDSHELVVHIPSRFPQVAADQKKLTQVLLNLVGNAMKYSPEGGEVTVRCVTEGDCVVVSVTDRGIGISPDELDLLFQPFGRIRKAETAKIGGTGLGLYITKNLVEAMGGALTVRSVPQEGSTFSFSLPLAASAREHKEAA